MQISFRDRWKRARRDTLGFRTWRRGITVPLLVGALTYTTLLRYGSAHSARDHLVAAVVAALVTAILLPSAEFIWNFARAPFRIAVDEIQRHVKEKEVLQDLLEAASGWKGITRTKLQQFWDRGAELRRIILDSTDDSESANQRWRPKFIKWRKEVFDYLHGLSPSKAYFLDEVTIEGKPISHPGKSLTQWKADLIKEVDTRLERLQIVMQDYPGGSKLGPR